MGLISAFVGGMAPGLSAMGKEFTDEESKTKAATIEAARKTQLMKDELTMQENIRQRAVEAGHKYAADTGAAIETKYQSGVDASNATSINQRHGSNIGASDLATANDGKPLNAVQRKAYGLIDATRAESLAGHADIAGRMGALDQERGFRDQAVVENTKTRDENNDTNTKTRLDNDATRNENQFKQSMAQATRQAAAIENNSLKIERQSQLKAAELMQDKAKLEYVDAGKTITRITALGVPTKESPEYAEYVSAVEQKRTALQQMDAAQRAVSGEGRPTDKPAPAALDINKYKVGGNDAKPAANAATSTKSNLNDKAEPVTQLNAKDEFMKRSSGVRSALQKQYDNAGGLNGTGKTLYDWAR